MINLSNLPKTWLIDIDGTIVKHNGYLEGKDELLDGVKGFFKKIQPEDTVILLTARKEKYKKDLEDFFAENNIKYDFIIFDLPPGERILINDDKPSGLKCAYAVCKQRDQKLDFKFQIDEDL